MGVGVRVKVLGPVAVVGADRELAPALRRLLAALVVRRGATASNDTLIDAMWPDGPPGDDGLGALRTAVSRLRPIVGADAVVTTAPGYRLVLETTEVDAWAFETSVSGRPPLEPADEVAVLDDALALWDGAAFEEFAHEPWAQGEAVRLEELRAATLEHRLELLLASGRTADAVADAARLVLDHPYRDRLRMVLIGGLGALGRQAEALRAFQDYREVLADAGLEPSAEVRALEQRLLAGDPSPGTATTTGSNAVPHSPPSGTVTFLFTDIEGSTPLWDAHPAAMRDALARHDAILRAAIDAAGGYVFATGGDGFCVAFHGAGSAVTAAMAAQQALAAEPWPEHVELRVRMGLHSGEADERDGNYFGPTVNRAARLMGSANGGQVVASAVTAGLVDDDEGVVVHDLGAVRLKGLVEPLRVFGLATRTVPWLDVALVSRQTSAGNLPRPQTDLVGDLVDLQHRVATLTDNRLVTLTGSGGVGKTRAAIEIGWLVIDEFPDGAWLIELAPIADPELIQAAIGSALGVQPQADLTLVEAIVDWCTDRRVLLIIDNCEHVLNPVTEVIDAIVNGCPTATVIATSREPLGVAGEYVVRIPSLEPVHGAELFEARAAAAGAQLTGTDDEAEAIHAICTRLDGIPLAIEIAAARTRSLTPTELLGRLDDRFRLLRGGGRGIERHQTLRATVAWSYQLLTDQQQRLFDRLSVFAGGFDLPTAEAICSDELLDELDIVDLLGELVDKSMVIADRTGTTTRYRLLETLRQYGEERLTDRDETTLLRDRHLAHYAELARPLWTEYLSAAQHEYDRLITEEWDNLRAAHSWAMATRALDEAGAIVAGIHYHAWSHVLNETSLLVDQTIALAQEVGAVDARVLICGAVWAFRNLDADRCIALAHEACGLADRGELSIGDAAAARAVHLEALTATGADPTQEIAAARQMIASTDDAVGHYLLLDAVMESHFDPSAFAAEALQLVEAADQTGSPLLIATARRWDGLRLLYGTDPPDIPAAMECFRQSAAMAAADGTRSVEGWGLWAQGVCAVLLGQADASKVQVDALRFSYEMRHPRVIDWNLNWIALHLISRSDLPGAVVIHGYLGGRRAYIESQDAIRNVVGLALTDVADAGGLATRGAAMSRAEIVAHATAALDRLDTTKSWQPPSLDVLLPTGQGSAGDVGGVVR